MKTVLLIRPRPHQETIGLQHVMVVEPLELEYLLGNVPDDLQNAFSLHIIDFIIDKRSFAQVLKTYCPSIVAFTGYNTHVNVIRAIAEEAKAFDPGIITAAGGVHAEVNREDFQSQVMDLIIWKQGIRGFQALLRRVAEEAQADTADDNGRAETAGEPPAAEKEADSQVTELESCSGTAGIRPENTMIHWMPLLQKEIDNWERTAAFSYKPPKRIGTETYRSQYYYMFHSPCALIKTSFGCPFQCSFCYCKVITGGKYNTRPMDEVIDELKSIKEEEIYIVDDDFLYSKDRIEDFLEALESEKIKKRYLVYGRSDFVARHPELMQRLKYAGLQAVIIGLESTREADLIRYNKRTSIEMNQKAIRILQGLDIEIYATLILPMDFTKMDFKTLRLWLKQMDLTFVNLQPLTPLKGTEIYEDYVKDFIVEPKHHEKWDMAHVVLKPDTMSVRRFYFEIIKLYYAIVMRPKNILRLLGKYGIKENMKMLRGSQKVSFQYMKKLLKG